MDPGGNEVGTHEQPFLWHPMIYHYGRSLTAPRGRHLQPARPRRACAFMRHDEINGKRFTEPEEVEFSGVKVKRGSG